MLKLRIEALKIERKPGYVVNKWITLVPVSSFETPLGQPFDVPYFTIDHLGELHLGQNLILDTDPEENNPEEDKY